MLSTSLFVCGMTLWIMSFLDILALAILKLYMMCSKNYRYRSICKIFEDDFIESLVYGVVGMIFVFASLL